MGGQAERAAGGKVDGEMTVPCLLFGARNNFSGFFWRCRAWSMLGMAGGWNETPVMHFPSWEREHRGIGRVPVLGWNVVPKTKSLTRREDRRADQ